MTQTPEETPESPLTAEVEAIMSAMTTAIKTPTTENWQDAIETMDGAVNRHRFTGIIKKGDKASLLLWNTSALLVMFLESSKMDPAMWSLGWEPFKALSKLLGVDPYHEIMLINESALGILRGE
jgi:hypothetical protein